MNAACALLLGTRPLAKPVHCFACGKSWGFFNEECAKRIDECATDKRASIRSTAEGGCNSQLIIDMALPHQYGDEDIRFERAIAAPALQEGEEPPCPFEAYTTLTNGRANEDAICFESVFPNEIGRCSKAGGGKPTSEYFCVFFKDN